MPGSRLLILAVARTNEVVGARWSEFRLDGEDPVWTIPAARVKNGSNHHVPLTPQMLQGSESGLTSGDL